MRRSSPDAPGFGPLGVLVATTRTVNPYGSLFGRPLDVCPAPCPLSRPLKLPASDGKRFLRSPMLSEATTPLMRAVRPLPLQTLELTCWKSPPPEVSMLSGYDPGATKTLQL